MTDEKKERTAEVNAAGKAHFDEVMEKIAAAREEWGPSYGGTAAEEALEDAFEYEIVELCLDLAHVRSLNAQALEALQKSSEVQASLAHVVEVECEKRIAAEKRTAEIEASLAVLPDSFAVMDSSEAEQPTPSAANAKFDGMAWIENISEGYDGRINLPVHAEGADPGSYGLDFQIRERSEPDPELVMDGYLKWSGCLDVIFSQTEDNCMTHFCEPEHVDAFAAALKWVWTQGPKILKWDRADELAEAIAAVVPPGAVPVAMSCGGTESIEEGITVTPCNFTFKPVGEE